MLTKLLICFLLVHNYFSIFPQNIENGITFEVLSAEVVERIEGANSNLTWEDNENYKAVILKVKANCEANLELYATDFLISYYNEKQKTWDRSTCQGISNIVSTEDDDQFFIVGEYAHFTAKKGTRYFKIFFGIENNANKINLLYAKSVIEDIVVKR
ncbi:MAG: hypothetical protein A2V93_02680 [Ignavibacteria bacterium RBG_16_34_14]|nr:MAG: hypothetical protein A2V93_02680 [Ignavibacteria bacterium RBG_16_34_14]